MKGGGGIGPASAYPRCEKSHRATITTAPRARKPRNPGRHAGPLVAADATMGRHPHPPRRHATDPLRPARLGPPRLDAARRRRAIPGEPGRSEEHTSELQSRENLVCRLLLE